MSQRSSRSRSRSRSPNAGQAIIFTIGRMNPPTSGHMKVVQEMLKKALALGQKNVYLILSHTTGDAKNPLNCSEKKDFLLNGMIDKARESLGARDSLRAGDIEVSLICGDDRVSDECDTKNWITSKLCEIMKNYDKTKQIDLYLYIGEDRANSYNWLSKTYNKDGALTHLTIMSRGLERPEGAISGTQMRQLIEAGNEEEFIEREMEAGLSREKAADMYKMLREYLSKTQQEPAAKKQKITSSARAKKTGGGKKHRKTRKRKTKRKYIK
jgi:hypothetical protein